MASALAFCSTLASCALSVHDGLSIRLIASVQSADPSLQAYAKAVMNATARRARAGDPNAKRAVAFLRAAQSANRSRGKLSGFLVTAGGRVVVGSFIQTG